MAAMSLFRRLPRSQPYICRRCSQKQCAVARASQCTFATVAARSQDGAETGQKAWQEQARDMEAGARPSMLSLLEERGFVKDIAGGRDALDWLLNRKPIGAYVGVDPTAPSMHVGHLLPLMVLYWLHLHGYKTVTLLGGGTVQIGDPSGRTTARARQTETTQEINAISIQRQLQSLWSHVKGLGIRHHFSPDIRKTRHVLNNHDWLKDLSAVELIKSLGSGMRLGSMLARDSVKVRMESGHGMAFSEFSYPLFQGYDWWHMYSNLGVQLQLGGSDQYGNICAGMDAVDHMRKFHEVNVEHDPLMDTFGLTTPLLTTASGEKFGKSAGNAVWLDPDMLNSFDLYQYFLRTADDDVERYLKLFTFLPISSINLAMTAQSKDASKRLAQHLLAKEVVELAHGAAAAKKAEMAHKEAFSQGTNTYSLGVLRKVLHGDAPVQSVPTSMTKAQQELADKISAYKKQYAASSGNQNTSAMGDASKTDAPDQVVKLPDTLLQKGSFAQVLYAAGLVSSRSEGHRLIKNKGAYVVLPNSGSPENALGLKWDPIPANLRDIDPNHYLIDFEALVLRVGKTKIQICQIITEAQFVEQNLSCPGWEARATAITNAE